MATPCLYDPYGSPIINRRFLKSSENGNSKFPAEAIRAMDPLKRLITRREWLTVSYLGDKIDANFGISEGIVSQRAMFAVTGGWVPIFYGEAQDWGDMAIEWLINLWFPNCDVRGPNFDFNTGLYMDSTSIDARGDAITLLTRSDGGTGAWPMLQRIPNRQIGQLGNEEKVSGGKYDGASIENGVIKNRYGYPIAYRKLGEERGTFEDLDSGYVIHSFEPRWFDQSRGFPLFMACLDEFRAMSQGQDWEIQAMNIASAIGIIEYNERGGPDLTDVASQLVQGASGEFPGVTTETLFGGMVRYFKSNSGSKLEQFENKRPGEDWESFNDRLIRVCCSAANWPYSLVWKKDGANGTATRADQNIARKSISDRQSLLNYPAVRQVRYAISVAIKEGLIPPYPGKDMGGFLKWGFSMPPLMTIDEGRDRDNDRQDYVIGWNTLEAQALKMGTTGKKIRNTRDRETRDLIERAQKIATDTETDFSLVLNLLQQTNPNGAAGTPQSDPTQPEPATP